MSKAGRIRRTIQDPIIKEAFARVREHYRDALENTPIDDPELIIKVRKMLHLLHEVEHDLQSALQGAELEAFQAQEQQRGILGDLRWRKK